MSTSVIIPVRNGARFIAEAIESIRPQLKGEDEVIVVDDGSTDATLERLTQLADGSVRLLKTGGQGVSAARNLGLRAAHGDFIAFLDHDDLWPARRHAALAGALSAEPELGAVFGRVRVRHEPCALDDASHLDGKVVCELVGSALYRREILLQIGGFDEGLRLREDADLQQRLLERGLRWRALDQDSLIYRRHSDNVTNDQAAMQKSLLDLARRKLGRRARPMDDGAGLARPGLAKIAKG